MALTVTAIAACTTVAPDPSVEIRMICAGPAQTSSRARQHPAEAEMGVMRQRADAEIGRKQHQRQHRRGDRAHAPCERPQRDFANSGSRAEEGPRVPDHVSRVAA